VRGFFKVSSHFLRIFIHEFSSTNFHPRSRMECLYAPDLDPTSRTIALPQDERAHARALRLRDGDAVLLSNGCGHCAEAVLAWGEFSKNTKHPADAHCSVVRHLPQHNEPRAALHLVLGALDNRDRMEFALEKCTELGIHSFTPLLADHSQQGALQAASHHERLSAKALAAMKQSQRSHLPHVRSPQSLSAVLDGAGDAVIVLADADGAEPQMLPESVKTRGVWVFVGPEGGFSARELQMMKEREGDASVRKSSEQALQNQALQNQALQNQALQNQAAQGALTAVPTVGTTVGTTIVRWNLGASRLRAETAAVLAVGTVALQIPR
jgi:16S rRNA (uracil1498-N3)-methyltransferase